MIPSVQERKKNIHNFMDSYPNLCRLQNTIPNPNIKVNTSNNFLDFIGDRIKLDDWKPLLEALSNDRSLHFISIRSKYNKTRALQESNVENQEHQIVTPKSSPSLTINTIIKITEALSKCLSNSHALTGLLMEKLPLNSESLSHLIQGLEVCRNLQQLSLIHCQIGDDGCASLCHVLRRRLNLVWLNLTGCGLTEKGVGMLCDLLKFQKLNRYGESWKQSLRCRPVNPNTMPGLRRLTLNNNPIGDVGVKIFIETLVDDLWLKALDMQNCGISLIGGEYLLSLVKENKFLSVVDIRGNIQVPKSIVAAIVQQLAENNSDSTPEFQWLKEDSLKMNHGSSTGISISKSSQRLVSNTTICSKRHSILSVLPNKSRPQASPLHQSFRTRSVSAKRAQTTNNTPRPPWNSNSFNSSLRRGNSDQLIIPKNKNFKEDILLELSAVKDQLQEVTQRLEEETVKRVRLEHELEKYKQMTEVPSNLLTVDKTNLERAFCQFYKTYINKDSSQLPKQEQRKEEDELNLDTTHESLEFLIKTVNGENTSAFNFDSKKLNSPSSDTQSVNEKQNPIDQKELPSRAQQLFEHLISS